VRTLALPLLREKVASFIGELRDVAYGKTRLPPKTSSLARLEELEQKVASGEVVVPVVPVLSSSLAPATASSASSTPPSSHSSPSAAAASAEPPRKKPAPSSTSFTLSEKFYCSPVDLMECFLEPNRVRAYAGGDSVVEGRTAGAKLRMFGGSVEATIVEVQYPNKLVENWRFTSWPEGTWSTVTINFTEEKGKTVLTLTHDGVQKADEDRTRLGWQENHFRPIKMIFGYGGL